MISQLGGLKRRGIVHVIGDWTSSSHRELSLELGQAIAVGGYSLMTSGLSSGVAMDVCEGFCSLEKRKGMCIGVVWGGLKGYSMPGYPNKWVEVTTYLNTPDIKVGEHKVTTRGHANDADVVIALPGAAQTRDEINQSVKYEHPIAVHPFWSDTFPELWDFEGVGDCMALVAAVLRDREKRPAVHALKVANCLSGKTAAMLRDEESRRCIEKGKDNEAYAKWLEEEERRLEEEAKKEAGMNEDEGDRRKI